MKVNYNNSSLVEIRDLRVGETFLAERSTDKEVVLYMKIDGKSGLIKSKLNEDYAVNVKSGQLRAFYPATRVTKVDAEVNVSK